jgi:hypothetical protein
MYLSNPELILGATFSHEKADYATTFNYRKSSLDIAFAMATC